MAVRNVHLADKPVLVDRPALLAARQLGRLGPHLLHILKHHVTVAVEGFYTCQELSVVSDRDQDLGVTADGGLEDRQRARRKFIYIGCGQRRRSCDISLDVGSQVIGISLGVERKTHTFFQLGDLIFTVVHVSCQVVLDAMGGRGKSTHVSSFRGFVSSSLFCINFVINIIGLWVH